MCRARLAFLLLMLAIAGCKKANQTEQSNAQAPPATQPAASANNTPTPSAPAPSAPPPSATRTVRIPTVLLNPANASQDTEKLAVTQGAADELPQGPTGFDVLGDGGFVISDPLRRRLALFESDGKYRSDIPLGFAAESVSVSGSSFEVRNASSGEVQKVATRGLKDFVAILKEQQLDSAAAKLLGPAAGLISLGDGELKVRFEQPGSRIVSIKGIARDGGSVYVALELGAGAAEPNSTVDVKKVVLKYDKSGRLLLQIPDIPVNYFVHPINEFRVRNGVVYQMAPLKEYVEIRSWDTKAL
jgi:hypothetical protein